MSCSDGVRRCLPVYCRYGSIEEFLNRRRKQLLRHLHSQHGLRNRVDCKTGQLTPDNEHSDSTRKILSDEAIKNYKRRRRVIDSENAQYHLQGSQLIQMWNAEYDSDEQWQDFDRVRNKMQHLKQRQFGERQHTLFLDDWLIRERRNRIRASPDTKKTGEHCHPHGGDVDEAKNVQLNHTSPTDHIESFESVEHDEQQYDTCT